MFGLFTIWPAINGFRISLYDSSNGRTFELRRDRELPADPRRRQSSRTRRHRATAIFVVLYVIVVTILSTVLALLLDAQRRGSGSLRAAYFLPLSISPVVVGLVWGWMFTRQNGHRQQRSCDDVGVGPQRLAARQGAGDGVIIAAAVWTHVGFYAMILLAGLKGIPAHLYEAATHRRRHTVQRLRPITLPLLRPTTMVVVVLSTIPGSRRSTTSTRSPAAGRSAATTLIVQYIYERAFQSPIQYGLASAAGRDVLPRRLRRTLINYFVGRRQEAM